MEGDFKFTPVERREPRRFEPPPWEPAAPTIDAEIVLRGETEDGAVAPKEEDKETGEPGGESLRIDQMFAELKAQEPTAEDGLRKITFAATGVVLIAGLLQTVLGFAALVSAKGSTSGLIVAVLLLGIGLGFLGVGIRLGYRTLRQRGVL